MDIIEMLKSRLDPDMINQLSQHIDAEDPERTEDAVNGVISTLVAGLSRNASQPGGAEELERAIERDHDGSVLDDASGFLFGNRQPNSPKTLNGIGILDHILGNNREKTTDMLGRTTGMDKSKILKLMITLAPMVLAALGKARNQRSGNGGFNVGDLLRGTMNKQTAQHREVGLLEKFLDRNGDGSVMDDLANMGKNLFRRR